MWNLCWTDPWSLTAQVLGVNVSVLMASEGWVVKTQNDQVSHLRLTMDSYWWPFYILCTSVHEFDSHSQECQWTETGAAGLNGQLATVRAKSGLVSATIRHRKIAEVPAKGTRKTPLIAFKYKTKDKRQHWLDILIRIFMSCKIIEIAYMK